MQPLSIFLISYLVLELVYEQTTPTFEASGDVWHFGMVRELAEGRGLPVQDVGRIFHASRAELETRRLVKPPGS